MQHAVLALGLPAGIINRGLLGALLWCRAFLARLNPLLGDAVSLKGGSEVRLGLTPADGLWPASAGSLRLEPLRVSLGQGAAVTRALGALQLADR